MSSQPPYRIKPAPDEHREQSRALIQRAAEGVAPGAVLVLGAGRADEIPLRELTERFARVVLNDIEVDVLEQAIATAELSADARRRVTLHVGDVTGVTAALVEQARAASKAASEPAVAAELLAAVVEAAVPVRFELPEQFDLIVSSCLLSQLHVPATEQIERVIDERFPGHVEALRRSRPWTEALYRFARRTEAALVESLAALVAPHGRIFLSESVQACFVEASDEGDWLTEGTYRMTRTLNLADYLDSRFRVDIRGRWNWVIPPQDPGQRGRMFDVQALVIGIS